MQKGIYLVTGGVRSGKSFFAEELVKGFSLPVIYLATAVITDEEMENRVKIHKERRETSWITYEEPYNLPALLSSLQGRESVILLDCLSVYISNLIWKAGENCTIEEYKLIIDHIHKLLDFLQNTKMSTVVVTSEVGLGMVPDSKLGRFYRDLMGETNQMFAKVAKEVYLVASGIPLALKKLNCLARSTEEYIVN